LQREEEGDGEGAPLSQIAERFAALSLAQQMATRVAFPLSLSICCIHSLRLFCLRAAVELFLLHFSSPQ